MPTYAIRCQNCGPQEIVAPMSEGAALMPCPVCQRARPQVFSPPMFVEDRLRFWKGPMGNGFSTALGERMPDSKTERDRIAKVKGIEFCSRDELLADNREAADAVAYHADVQSGGSRVDWTPPDTSVFQSTPDWAKPLLGGD